MSGFCSRSVLHVQSARTVLLRARRLMCGCCTTWYWTDLEYCRSCNIVKYVKSTVYRLSSPAITSVGVFSSPWCNMSSLYAPTAFKPTPILQWLARPQSHAPGQRIAGQRRNITIKQLEAARNDRERVVILGSGWAGYNLARSLDPRKFQTVVVSPRSYFVFTPLLASTSVGTLEFRTALEPVRTRNSKYDYIQGRADGISPGKKQIMIRETVRCPNQGLLSTRAGDVKDERPMEMQLEASRGELFSMSYDKLVIGVGSYSQTFGISGVKENAYFLKDVQDARKIRDKLLSCFETAALPTTPVALKKQLLNFAIVGKASLP